MNQPPKEATTQTMTSIVAAVDQVLNGSQEANPSPENRKHGIVILVFNKNGEPGNNEVNYVANVSDRKQMVGFLREVADRLERGEEKTPNTPTH